MFILHCEKPLLMFHGSDITLLHVNAVKCNPKLFKVEKKYEIEMFGKEKFFNVLCVCLSM